MRSQICFAMHPDDEREFELLILQDESVRFIDGPRWKTPVPVTSRTLAEVGSYCIVWSVEDAAELKSRYMQHGNDWYCESENATIQFLRSEIDGTVLTQGRIAICTNPNSCEYSAKSIEKRFTKLRSYIKRSFSNGLVRWRNPEFPYLPAGPNRSANPSEPDLQMWVGEHAERWLRESRDRRFKQFRQGGAEAVLVDHPNL